MAGTANKLVKSISEACRREILGRKWLIAPSLRAGWQWLENAAFCGTAVVNVGVYTVRSLARELAGPELAAAGFKPVDPMAGAMLVADDWRALLDGGKLAFLGRLQPSLELFERLWGSIRELRLAGIAVDNLPAGRFEDSGKGADVALLLRRYERRLADEKLADEADVIRTAIDVVHRNVPLDASAILMPPGLPRCRLERQLIESLPKERLILLETDRPVAQTDLKKTPAENEKPANALEMLKWINLPSEAPDLSGQDGSVEIIRCVGQANEIRSAMRTILNEGLRFDEAEIICTQADPYIGIIHELAECYRPAGQDSPAGLPVTFADGLAAEFSRPGRALAGWLDWIQNDYPQTRLINLLHDGLLCFPAAKEDADAAESGLKASEKPDGTACVQAVEDRGESGANSSQLAGLLGTFRIGLGVERYVPAMESQLRALDKRLEKPAVAGLEEPEMGDEPEAIRRRIAGMKKLLPAVRALVRIAPGSRGGPAGLIRSARVFLDQFARSVNEHDNLSRQALIEKLDQMLIVLDGRRADYLDAFGWLRSLLSKTKVGGSRPRPGCLHVAALASGGYSGRRRTFIVGLDDGSFPGAVRPDPILLDHERNGLSRELATRAGQTAERLEEFGRVVCGLRGRLTLSFSSTDVGDQRELFPAGVLLNAWRLVGGRRHDDQSAMLGRLAPPASFAPGEPDSCLDETQWWLARCCGGQKRIGGEALESRRPDIARGIIAVAARAGEKFTEFDGRVNRAAISPDFVMSANKFQTLGACPLRFFYRYVLGVKPGLDISVDPAGWLNHAEYGDMLHEVFHDFIGWAVAEGGPDAIRPDAPKMKEFLSAALDRWTGISPPPSQAPYLRQRRLAQQSADIFLAEEQIACAARRPLYVEASIGMPPVGNGTPIDSLEPIALTLAGRAVKIQGRIDRIDEQAGGGFVVVDYKTGRLTAGYENETDPFDGGRIVQHALYCRLVAKILRDRLGRDERVCFEYFFPGPAATGKRVRYEPEQLKNADKVLSSLLSLAEAGCFPASTHFKGEFDNDCRFCDFAPVCVACGGLENTCLASRAKLACKNNDCLQPWLDLRGEDGD